MARIVIVDDDEVMAEIVTEVLETNDHMVSAVHNGDDALQAVIASEPDLIILDYSLPGRTGMEILRQIRAMPRLAGIPVMMLTGNRGKLLVARAEHDGADDYLTKPFDPRELLTRVETLLLGRSVAQCVRT